MVEAARALRTLREGNQNVANYATTFRRLSLLRVGYDELSIVQLFHLGLNDETLDMLLSCQVAYTLEDLIQDSIAADYRFELVLNIRINQLCL